MTNIVCDPVLLHDATPPAGRLGLVARLRHWLAERRTQRSLAELDDHVLADIGYRRVPQSMVSPRWL